MNNDKSFKLFKGAYLHSDHTSRTVSVEFWEISPKLHLTNYKAIPADR